MLKDLFIRLLGAGGRNDDRSVSPLLERWNNRAVIQLLWPLAVEQVLGVTIGLVDTVMMSAVGEYAISGVSLVDAIATLLIIAFGALATGGAVVISQYLGRADPKSANAAARQLIYVSVITACFIMVIALVFGPFFLRVIYGNIAPDVMAAAKTYFFFSALSYPALALYNASAALFRSMGNSRVTMMVSLLMNILHIILNFVFIYRLHLGVDGAALSTLASRILGGAVLLVLLMKGKRMVISLSGLFRIKLETFLIRIILRVGVPTGVESSLFQLGKILVARIATSFGTAAIAANAVTGSVNAIVTMPGNAISIAMLTIISQCIGARDYDSAKYFTRRLMVLTHVLVTVVCVLNLVFMEPMVSLFELSREAHVMAVHFLGFLCIMMVITWPSSFALPNALRAAGDVRYVMVVAAVSMWLVRVLGAYLCTFMLGAGVFGIWYAWVADWLFRSIFFVARWFRGKWQKIQVLSR